MRSTITYLLYMMDLGNNLSVDAFSSVKCMVFCFARQIFKVH